MTVEELLKKVEGANEVAEMASQTDHYCVCVEIDSVLLYDYSHKTYTPIWFRTFKDLKASLKRDWFKSFVEQFSKVELKPTKSKGEFKAILSGCSIVINVALRRFD